MKGNNEGQIITYKNIKSETVVFEGYIFDQDPFVLKLGVTVQSRYLRNILKTNGGVKVFRDKLRVYDYGRTRK